MGKFFRNLAAGDSECGGKEIGIIDAVRDLDDLRTPPGNRLGALSCDRRGSTASKSTRSGASALSGKMKTQTMLKSLIIAKEGV